LTGIGESFDNTSASPDQQQITEEVGPTEVDRRAVVVVGPPLWGSHYRAAARECSPSRLCP